MQHVVTARDAEGERARAGANADSELAGGREAIADAVDGYRPDLPGLQAGRAFRALARYLGPMPPDLSRALLAPELWLTLRRTSADGRACRDYAVLDPAGAPLLQARAFNWSREIRVTDATGEVAAVIRRSRAFALNGRAGILDAAGQRLGQLRRTGAFADAGGRPLGRFRDARTFGSRAGESVLQGVVDAVLGGEGTTTTSGPESFVLLVEDRLAGSLVRAVVPWAEPEGGSATSRRMPQWLAGRIRALTTTRGWRFQRSEPTGADPLIEVAAALFAIELSRW